MKNNFPTWSGLMLPAAAVVLLMSTERAEAFPACDPAREPLNNEIQLFEGANFTGSCVRITLFQHPHEGFSELAQLRRCAAGRDEKSCRVRGSNPPEGPRDELEQSTAR
jgi:hypothetical protein